MSLHSMIRNNCKNIKLQLECLCQHRYLGSKIFSGAMGSYTSQSHMSASLKSNSNDMEHKMENKHP